MKVLADECVPMQAVVMLRSAGHEVRNIARSPEAGLDDDSVWRLALDERRLLVTSDKKFLRRRNEPHFGMIVIRLRQTTPEDFRRRLLDAICEVLPEQWPGLTMVVRDRAQTLYRNQPDDPEE